MSSNVLGVLKTLGFFSPPDPSIPETARQEYALREFQTYAAGGFVAEEAASAVLYSDRLRPVKNTRKFEGPPHGALDAQTQALLEHWTTSNWRCPVVVEAWWTRPAKLADPDDPRAKIAWAERVAIVNHPKAQNLWLRSDGHGLTEPAGGPSRKGLRIRMYARDFSQRLAGLAAFDELVKGDNRILLAHHVFQAQTPPAKPWDGPVSVAGEVRRRATPEALTGLSYADLGSAIRQVTFRIVHAVSNVECGTFLDSITAYDRAVMSIGTYHWTLSRFKSDGTFERGELEALLAYLRKVDVSTFDVLIAGSGVEPFHEWYEPGTKATAALANSAERKFENTLAWYTRPDPNKPPARVEVPRRDVELNFFRSWHWFYRFQIGTRVLSGLHRAFWDFSRFRIRDILALELPDSLGIPPNTNQKKVRLGDVFRSEAGVALLLQSHVYDTRNVVRQGRVSDAVVTAVKNAGSGEKPVPLNQRPETWDESADVTLQKALLAALKSDALKERQARADTSPVRARYPYPGTTRLHLSARRNTFEQLDDSNLYPPPPWE